MGTNRQFVGMSSVTDFMAVLEEDCKTIFTWSQENAPKLKYIKECIQNCLLCHYKFKQESEKFADHDHLSEKYLQVICQECNNKLKVIVGPCR